MGKARRLAVVGVAAVLSTAVATSPAGAQARPEAYTATSVAKGLDLTIGGNGVTFGLAETAVESTPKATARGVGQANPAQSFGEQTAESTADGQTDEKPDGCETPALPEQLPLTLGLACSSARTTVAGGLPSAASTGSVANVGLAADNVLVALPVTEPLQEGVGSIFDGLQPIFDLDPNLANVGTTVRDLLTDVLTTDTLRIQAGPSRSVTTTDDKGVTTTASTSGVIVDLLPTGAAGEIPVARIEVGAATATAAYDRAAGKASAVFTPALVKVTIAPDILAALPPDLVAGLPFEGNSLSITVVDTTCLPLPDPLTSCITVGGGQVTENEDGSVSSFAAGVSLDLLKGLQGGVQLELASARATAGGAPAVEVLAELPRTGGTPAPLAPLVGVGLLGAAGFTWWLAHAQRRRPEQAR